jgi:2-amino-4-hydroxy-6-hydroxymethyldihydropteridine diphosphokinase
VSAPGAAGCREIVLSLGANLGDRLANLQLGIDLLTGDGLEDAEVSSVYQSAPVGGPDQDDYLNAVLIVQSALTARDILRRAAAAEAAAGRVRTIRWGPRTLDIDIITSGDEQSSDPALTLPHPRARERAFVLVPWLELRADAVLPGSGPAADLLAAAVLAAGGTAGVQHRPELRLTVPGRDGAAPCG